MKLFQPLLAFISLQGILMDAEAQTEDTAAAQVIPQVEQNRVTFGSALRPLRQIAGAPEAFYTYFWEFGDGTYSFEKEPAHVYKDTGWYTVRLYATNNYDDGKKPPTRPRPVRVKQKSLLAGNKGPSFFKTGGSLEMKTNQMPRPGEDMVLLIGYRNRPDSRLSTVSGSILLLYNERQFSQNSFEVADVRRYGGEKTIGLDSLLVLAPVPHGAQPQEEYGGGGLFTASVDGYAAPSEKLQLAQLLKQEMSPFRQHRIWRVEQLSAGEEKFLFLSVNTLPEMIKDTNAVVTISGLFVPDDPSLDMEKFDLELPVVASHDPNRISLKNHKLNYRFTGKNKDNLYKIRFQNTGKGPAKKVAITVTVPGMLDGSSVELVDMKPFCIPCDSAYEGKSCLDTVLAKDSIQFIFRNIYLPGMQQDGVSDPDSTMGYIRYRIRFDKKVRKVPFTSQAAIVFDKNEPIYTNRSVGRFKKGISPGIILGYNLPVGGGQTAPRATVLGVTLSEYAAYKRYFQWELYLQPHRQYERFVGRRLGGDTVINRIPYKVEYRDRYERIKVLSLEAVPLQLRYNLTSFISAGAGGIITAEISRSTTPVIRALLQPNGTNLNRLEGEEATQTRSFARWRAGLFADVQLGRVRTGPAAGVRLVHYTRPAQQSILFYVTWKF